MAPRIIIFIYKDLKVASKLFMLQRNCNVFSSEMFVTVLFISILKIEDIFLNADLTWIAYKNDLVFVAAVQHY